MENQTIVELIDKNNFTMSDLKDTVYSTLAEKSTRRNPLTIEDVRCTLSFTKPPYITNVKNPENYYYFIMELGGLNE